MAQQVPLDVGTVVPGYQDDFDGAALNPNWTVRGTAVYSVSGGQLHIATASGDPNHLLYELAGYDNTVQEVLVRIRVTSFGTGDGPRGGAAVSVDTATSQGINLHFRDENLGRHVEFLDDARAWGTEYYGTWLNNTWYWLRLRHEPNAASQGGVNDVFGKMWLADGSQAEPAAWQMIYDYTPTRTTRTGYAGIAAGSLAGTAEYDVDYVLIKATGLPNITVAPNAFVQTPVAITNQPQSQTVVECRPAMLTVGASGNPQPTFQWFKGGVAIPSATNSSYSLANVSPTDAGSYRVVAQNVVSNVTYSATSSVATLTVSTDTVQPLLTGAQSLGLTQVRLAFSEPISLSTATNTANYQITNGSGSITISNAMLEGTLTNVLLTCGPMTEGASYTLVVNGIRDSCASANPIPPNSTATFVVASYVAQDIGNPNPSGSSVATSGGYDITGGGADIGGTNDQFQFTWQQRTGDFDVKVRLASLGLSDAWTEAGLMAREALDAGSRFASAMATPSISGCYFQSRTTTNGATGLNGSFPANYPNTWLRLQRAGSVLTGFAGYDGQSWTPLGSATIAMPPAIYVGFAVSSHNTNQSATAAFRDFEVVTSVTTNALPITVEPLGQSSRLTSLVISEIMYHPTNRADGKKTEFVELFNTLGEPADISGYRLSGEVNFTFPTNTILPGGGFVVVARAPADVQSVYGITGVLGPFANTNNLSNKAGVIRLRHRTGAVLLEAKYDSDAPYPLAADGAGHSLVLARPSYGEGNALAWAASDSAGGSPGRLDPVTLDPQRSVVINELLAHTDLPDLDYIELYNHGNDPLDLTGCFLSDDPATNKFTMPPGTIVPGRGFAVFYETNLNFALSSHGEEIYLRNAAGTRVLDAVRFGAQENGVSTGRSPNGGANFHRMSTKTPGASNSPPRFSEVVINEIMYNPISGSSDDEYVELYNRSTNTIDLYKWKLDGGINFTFKRGTLLPPDSYLVVANNITNLLAKYSNLHSNNTVGNYGGALGNTSDRLALSKPEFEVSTNLLNQLVTNNVDIVVNELTYQSGGRWGQWADGGGSSLELVDARADNRLAANWADSDETAKAPWTVVTSTGTLDNGNVAADQLQVLLQGAGECLIDNVEVVNSSSVNVITNSTFEADAAGWTAEGTEAGSSLETTSGYSSSKSYHIRAVDRGDNQINRVRTPLSAALTAGTTATINAKVRWLRGAPDILFRLRGNWLEAFSRMSLPPNPGTPGARNSRAATNAPPAIYEVAHSPVLPAANQPCVVMARVSDPDQPSSMVLKFRLDPSGAMVTTNMVDNGTGGDAVAGDGIFSATIPGQPAATMVAFHIQATDAFGAASTFPSDATNRECLVRFGELQPTGNFPVYRIWMTRATSNSWAGLSATPYRNLNNAPFNVVFVLGNQRAIYNTLASYAGSPYIGPGYTTPAGGRCGYSVTVPTDDRFLGNQDLVLDWPGGHGNETSAMQEQMAYWMTDKMGLPYSHRYTIRLHVNGVTDVQRSAVFEAVNQPAGDFIRAWSPDDSSGDFYKIDRGFEFSDAGALVADPQPRLEVYTTTGGVKKQARYRWNWAKRSTAEVNNYTNLFALVDAVNSAAYDPYTSQTEGLMDTEEWMGILATEHIIVNFDAYGHAIGKNMYAYKPEHGKWQLYMFDLDWLMLAAAGNNIGTYGPSVAPLFNSEDPTMTRMYNHPPFLRAYYRTIKEAVDGPLTAANCNPVMDLKYASLLANGIQFCDGQALASPAPVKTWFSDRRAALVTQLAALASPFTVSATNFTVSSNVVTLSGTAQFNIKTIEFNGVPYPITWTSISNWTARVPLNLASNLIAILGYDRNGQLVSGASNQVSVTFTGATEPAVGNIVINELMFHGLAENSEYIEFYNRATNTMFDLSGWRVNGLDYTFPEGSVLAARSFLVLAKDRSVFSVRYGGSIPVFGEFDGDFQLDGETISLIDTNGTIIDRVRYEGAAPWSTSANGTGSSFQLIDAGQENARVGNWFSSFVPAVYSGGVSTPAMTNAGWRFVSTTGIAGSGAGGNQMRLVINLGLGEINGASVVLDDISVVEGTNAAVGPNFVHNGDFETSPLLEVPAVTNSWHIGTNYTNTAIVSDPVHGGGGGALKLVCQSFGNAQPRVVSQLLSPAPLTNAVHTLSFWFNATNTATNLTVKILNSSPLNITTNVQVIITPSNYVPPTLINAATNWLSPGTANQNTTNLTLPPLWINEVQAENLTGLFDSYGERDPWIEIYNPSTNIVSLDGLFLSGNYSNLTHWAFPPGASIGPTQFLVVFCDGQPLQTSNTEYHTSFRLPASSGSVFLSQTNGALASILLNPTNRLPVLDYVNYEALSANHSYGSFPDGQPFDRFEFLYVTPRGTNDGRAAPLAVFINEWMAANTNTVIDPADGDHEDWFEIYNPGTNTVDLTGYYLTDTLADKFKYLITTNGPHTIGPHGHLLVWADNETGQNTSGGVPRTDLHVNFQLAKAGEAIGLFAANGAQIDAITFTNQTDDISQGRCPDGSTNIIPMPAATPRTANTGCGGINTPPVLLAIGGKFVYLGQTLSFNAAATDADLPPQTLSFTLDPGAPAGALINLDTGLFTWTPLGPAGTNQITVRVRDNGTPPLDDAETIAVIVSLPPGFTAAHRNGNALELTWATHPGKTYRVESTGNLTQPDWQPLGDLPAISDTLSITNTIAGPQLFYRIKLVD